MSFSEVWISKHYPKAARVKEYPNYLRVYKENDQVLYHTENGRKIILAFDKDALFLDEIYSPPVFYFRRKQISTSSILEECPVLTRVDIPIHNITDNGRIYTTYSDLGNFFVPKKFSNQLVPLPEFYIYQPIDYEIVAYYTPVGNVISIDNWYKVYGEDIPFKPTYNRAYCMIISSTERLTYLEDVL